MSLEGKATGQTLVGKINGLDTLTISAYGIAVKNGFKGTEEEWLASLKGDKGDKGDKGEKGDVGYYDGEVITAEMVGARPNTWTPTAEEVGARPDTWLPTIAEIGAAPTKYGVGEYLNSNGTINNLDNATLTGRYGFFNTANFIDGHQITQGVVDVISYLNLRNHQTLYPNAGNHVLHRWRYEGEWQPWEWVNPPMAMGVEYRTTKRIAGYPVYTKFFSLGNCAVGATGIAISDDVGTWKNIVAITDGNGNDLSNHPYITSVYTQDNNIIVNVTTGLPLCATVEFIKRNG